MPFLSSAELRNRKAELSNLQPKSQSRFVYLVTKLWHTQLVSFLENPVRQPPGIDNSPLQIPGSNSLRQNLQYGVDYEIVEASIWEDLHVTFGGPGPAIERKLSISPTGQGLCVILFPVVLEMQTPKGVRTKTCNTDWKISYLKRPLCNAIGVFAMDYIFVTPDTGFPVDENEDVGEYTKVHGKLVKLERKPKANLSSTLGRRDNATNFLTSTMPRPTFADPDRTSSIDYTYRSGSCLDRVFPKPVGIVNLGNTCFFNAAVQCIVRIKPLVNFMFSPDFEVSINPNNPLGSKGEIALAFRKFLQEMSSNTNTAKNPRAFRNALVKKFRIFANYGQHDSQEVLCAILDGLHEDLNQSNAARGIPVPNYQNPWESYLSRNSSKIVDLFHGALSTVIRCPNCGNTIQIMDPFVFLSLPIPRRASYHGVRLEDCFQLFTQEEVLDANNMWECPRCTQRVRAIRCVKLTKIAPVLIIHLKRFSGGGRFSAKIDTQVKYPSEIQSKDICTEDYGTYKLTAVVFHFGGMLGGHYTASAIDPQTQKWYNFNDSTAEQTEQKSAIQSNAYILFYQREDFQ